MKNRLWTVLQFVCFLAAVVVGVAGIATKNAHDSTIEPTYALGFLLLVGLGFWCDRGRGNTPLKNLPPPEAAE